MDCFIALFFSRNLQTIQKQLNTTQVPTTYLSTLYLRDLETLISYLLTSGTFYHYNYYFQVYCVTLQCVTLYCVSLLSTQSSVFNLMISLILCVTPATNTKLPNSIKARSFHIIQLYFPRPLSQQKMRSRMEGAMRPRNEQKNAPSRPITCSSLGRVAAATTEI